MSRKTDEKPWYLIECGDHNLAPWSLVCEHLIDGEPEEWFAVKNKANPEVDYDWYCYNCISTIDAKLKSNDSIEEDMEKLSCVCIHCVRDLRRQYDDNFDDE